MCTLINAISIAIQNATSIDVGNLAAFQGFCFERGISGATNRLYFAASKNETNSSTEPRFHGK